MDTRPPNGLANLQPGLVFLYMQPSIPREAEEQISPHKRLPLAICHLVISVLSSHDESLSVNEYWVGQGVKNKNIIHALKKHVKMDYAADWGGVVSPHLTLVKATLLSMLPLFIPPRYYNEITLGLARRSTEVAICISKLIEQRETPSLVEDVSELEE